MKPLFFKKNHLGLNNLNLTESHIPVEKLGSTKHGHHLKSLSLAHNQLETLPQGLVQCLPNLISVNISHCLIYKLPNRWNLPLLKKSDLSHNLLIDFPEEVSHIFLLMRACSSMHDSVIIIFSLTITIIDNYV
jgi:Leucine-rich repeat (LRR) protein